MAGIWTGDNAYHWARWLNYIEQDNVSRESQMEHSTRPTIFDYSVIVVLLDLQQTRGTWSENHTRLRAQGSGTEISKNAPSAR